MTESQCRICLQYINCLFRLDDKVKDLFIWEALNSIANVNIALDDLFPQNVCWSCFQTLDQVIQFQSEVEKSDSVLHSNDIECITFVKEEFSDNRSVFEPAVVIQSNKPEIYGNPPKLEDDTTVQDIKTDCPFVVDTESIFDSKSLISQNERRRRNRKSRAKAFVEAEKARKNRILCCMCGGLLFATEKDLLSHISSLHSAEVKANKKAFYTTRHIQECKYCKKKFRLFKSIAEHKEDKNFKEKPRNRTSEIKSEQKKREMLRMMKEGIKVEPSLGEETSQPKAEASESWTTETPSVTPSVTPAITPTVKPVSKPKTNGNVSKLTEEERKARRKANRKSRAKAFVEAEQARKNRIMCCMCGGLIFQTEKERLDHISKEHTAEIEANKKAFYTTRQRWECKYCKKRFRLNKSITNHFEDKNFKEPRFLHWRERDKTKGEKKVYKKHVGEPVVCTSCGILLANKEQMRMHELRMHATEFPFECPHPGCGKKFAAARILRIHTEKHAERKHICDVCGKGFTKKNILTSHSYLHMEVKRYQCAHCPRTFTYKEILKLHIQSHFAPVEFPCTMCDKTYKWKNDLKYHIKGAHLGTYPYKCKFCDKGYFCSSSRKYHQDRCPQSTQNLQNFFPM